MKKCFKCLEEKARSEFYAHKAMADGLLGKCKECTKKDSNERFLRKLQDPEWAIKERKRQREKEERRRVLGLSNYRKQSKPAPKANVMFYNAVKSGKIKRMPCEICGKENAQGHHEDYSMPYDVVWLCTRHHADRHIHLRDCKTLRKEPMAIAEFIKTIHQHTNQ